MRYCTFICCAGALLFGGLSSLTATAEVYVERPARALGDAAEVRERIPARRILINGMPSIGRHWIVKEHYDAYAQRVAQLPAGQRPFAPVKSVGPSALSVVTFLGATEGSLPRHARVLIAQPAGVRGQTSVWESEVLLTDFLAAHQAALQGDAAGRDHPMLGAPASARRVNVIESLDPSYSYSAVYETARDPRTAVTAMARDLQRRGATLDTEKHEGSDAYLALTKDGRRIELFASRRGVGTTQLVIQTDLASTGARATPR